uniref:Cuticular protein n=1 Tax=Nilaparvata lugens TaxID=108931 RepID=A0A2S1ZS14_NILLU|nr:cuticular protein [Nilaparvata lugens]
MACKYIVFTTLLAFANAGFPVAPVAPAYPAYAAPAYAAPAYAAPVVAKAVPAAVTSQSANILRSYGNLGQVSTYTKTIDTPYSSVSKSDVRVSNPGYATYAAPAYHAPAAYAAPAYTAPVAYKAPVAAYAAPAYAAPAYHAPAAYAAPVAKVAASPLLGVAYSAAPAVAHISFDGFGAHYVY